MSIATPEGVDIELTLAGVGSRFAAVAVDQIIQALVLFALGLLAAIVGGSGDSGGGAGAGVDDTEGSAALAVAVLIVFVFAVQVGYHVLFETFASGRTPGKRWAGLRVVTVDGGPVGFVTSAVRNLVRVVDMLPTMYVVGIVAVLATSHNQRLGDLAAGTLVIRERTGGRTPARGGRRRRSGRRPAVQLGPPPAPGPTVAAWDVSSITADELATVRRFLDRRATLAPDARGRLSRDLAARLRPKVVGPPDDLHPELFLEEVAAAKAARL